MAKEPVNPRKIKSSLRSIKDFPFTKDEIKEMQAIQDKQYWARAQLKETFCDKNNRLVTEVNEYFKTHQRPPLGGGQRGTSKRKSKPTVDTNGSILAPKEQVTTPEHNNVAKISPTGEIRVKYKELRIEEGEIIFVI